MMLTSSRGAASLCSSTLEKLRGFSCSAEPSAGRSDTQREEKKTDGASSKICVQTSSAQPPRDAPDPCGDKNRLHPPEEEHEDEEEEVKGESSGLTAMKQVPRINVDSITPLSSEYLFRATGWTEDEGFSLLLKN